VHTSNGKNMPPGGCRRGHGAALLLIVCACTAPAAFPAAAAQAQTDAASVDALKSLSLEDLTNVVVTSVARHPEKLLQSASAIQVITQEDIRRSGATTLPEVLRLATNLEVAQKNSHDWAISARGFNTALANKLLVMIDGRTVYTPLYSGVFWDVQDYLLEDIDRIEVISGPGGTLWGANAVNGVINIITKSAADTQGLYVEGAGGSHLQQSEAARYGGSLAPGVQFRVYGKYLDDDGEQFADGADAPDSWRRAQGGFRVDSGLSARNAWTVQGDAYSGYENVPTGGAANTGGGNLLGRWSRSSPDGSNTTLQSYLDRTHLSDPVPAFALNTLVLAPSGFLVDDLTTFDVDFQHSFHPGRFNRIVWGLGYRHTHDVVQSAPALSFSPPVLDQDLYSAFLQDEIALRSDLTFTVGSKLEHNDFTGFEFEPNVRLLWSLDADQALWGAVSRAVRTPSRIDRDFAEPAPPHLVVLEGGEDFRSETLIAYELGYRAQLDQRLSASVATFYNDYDDIRSTSYTPGTVLPFFFANRLAGHTYGAELSASYRLLPGWSVKLGYDLLREHLHVKPGSYDLNDALNETADPEHQFSLRSQANLTAQLDFDAVLRWVDTLHINDGAVLGTVPAYFELDSRIAWHAPRGLEFSLVGQNLLHARHPEYGFPSPAREEIVRSVYGKVAWHF
jgi:iron complex outermembrane receptor protein